MKIISEVTPEEIARAVPRGLLDALLANADDCFYCGVCDGLRMRVHDCACWNCGRSDCEDLICLKGN